MAFIAKFQGWCEEGDPITPGDEVFRAADGYYRHTTCPTTSLDREEAKAACTKCFIIHPEGDCD